MWPFQRNSKAGSSSGFSWYSTAEEVTAGIDGSRLTAIITGATSGIGKETARVLALRGVHVIMAVRSTAKGEEAKESILQDTPSAKVHVLELDLSSMASVRKFAAEFLLLQLPLNILINNAGVGSTDFTVSKDGIELVFATNYLGHFLLTNLLLDKMRETSKSSGNEGRVVNLSSSMHTLTYTGGIRFDCLNEKKGHNRFRAYGQSKLASILHVKELTRIFQKEGVRITANSLHPGFIPTNIVAHNQYYDIMFKAIARLIGKTIQQGAATTCYVALHPQVGGISGNYFVDCDISKPKGWATDEELSIRLWDFSMKLINNLCST